MKQGIGIDTYLATDIEHIFMRDNDLVDILGIFLDNATEAAAESKEKMIYLEISQDEAKKRTVVKIVNTLGKVPDMDRIFDYGYTTKGKSRGGGIGMYEAKRIMDKYFCSYKVDFNNETGLFSLELYIS